MKNEKWKSLRWVGVGVDVGVERGIKRETILQRHIKNWVINYCNRQATTALMQESVLILLYSVHQKIFTTWFSTEKYRYINIEYVISYFIYQRSATWNTTERKLRFYWDSLFKLYSSYN